MSNLIDIGSRVKVYVFDGHGGGVWADGTVTGDDYGSDEKGWSWAIKLDTPTLGRNSVLSRGGKDRIRLL